MRLWHKDLITALPDKQLLSQWRECCAIASNIATKGTPNHLLVNKVVDYPIIHFTMYTDLVLQEMRKRKFKINQEAFLRLTDNIEKGESYFKDDPKYRLIKNTRDIYKGWHNKRYLLQCYNNLEEKHDCGGILESEWIRFFDHVCDLL